MFFQSVENCHRFPAFSYPRVLHSALSMNREWEVVEGRKGIMLVSKCHIVRGGARSQVWNWMLCSLIFNPQSKQKCYEIGSTVRLATASEVCQYAESNQNIPAARPTARPKPQRGRETFYSKPSVTLSLLL